MALKYIEASDSYLNDPNHHRSMLFDSWPDIRAVCPICSQTGCAVFRGYYSRFLFCSELEFVGRLAIRTGYCKCKKIRFSLCPDFIFPGRRISRFSLHRLREAKSKQTSLCSAIDDLISDLGEEFYLPISTAHSYLRLQFDHPP